MIRNTTSAKRKLNRNLLQSKVYNLSDSIHERNMINPFDFLSMDELPMLPIYEDIDIDSLIDNQENMSMSSITRAEPIVITRLKQRILKVVVMGLKVVFIVILIKNTRKKCICFIYVLLHIKMSAFPSLASKGWHTLLLRGGRRGFDPGQLRRTKRAIFPPLAI
jgi:hypothetical protein